MNKQVVYYFTVAIGSHDIEKIYSMMAHDHTFIDALGNKVIGRDKMKAGWAGYFQWFPDYKIELTDIFEDSGIIAAFGFAEGHLKGLTQKITKITGACLPPGKRWWRTVK